jgi:uncharacterized protein
VQKLALAEFSVWHFGQSFIGHFLLMACGRDLFVCFMVWSQEQILLTLTAESARAASIVWQACGQGNQPADLVDKPLLKTIIRRFASAGGFMIISLLRMPPDGLAFKHQYRAGELETGEYDFEMEEPPLVVGRATYVGQDVRLRGEIKAKLSAPCDRCLSEVTIPVEIPFDLFYAPDDPGAGQIGEYELRERDLDFAVYENDQIDLDELILEQLELSLPYRILCGENCRGLCPQCGADLNVEQCGCKAWIDPRWQALAELRDEMEKNDK